MVQWKIPILFLLLIISVGTLYTETLYHRNRPVDAIIVNYSNYNDVIRFLAKKEHLDLEDKTIYYKLLIGGRPIEIKDKKIISTFLNVPVSTIHFAAYIRGRGWIELPFIPYSLYIRAVGGDYYKMDSIITENTTIKLRLPPELPIVVDPRKEVPNFARGSRGWYVYTIEVEKGIEVPIYVFVYSHVRNTKIYMYTTLTSISTAWDTAVETPGLDLLLKYVRKGIVKATDLEELIDKIERNPISFNGITCSTICPPNDPTCSLPDGGGSNIPDRIKYSENWPTALGKEMKIELYTNETKYFYIRPVYPLDSYWTTVSPEIIEMGLTITAVPTQTIYEDHVLMVWIDNAYLGYSTVPGYKPSVSFFYKYYPGLAELNKTFCITIKIIGRTAVSWNISVRSYIVYEIDEKFYRDSFKTKFVLSPFQESADPPAYNTILLRRTFNYTYRLLIPIPLPSGGYFNEPGKLFSSNELTFTLKTRIISAISSPYKFRIGVCLGTYCIEKRTLLYNSVEDELEYTRPVDQYFVDEITGFSQTDGSIPLVLYIEPIDTPAEDRIEVFVRITNISPIVVRVVPPRYSRYGPWYHKETIFSTIYNKDYILVRNFLKDVVSTVMCTQRILVDGSVNKFYPTLFNVKYSIAGISRDQGMTTIYMELKPFISTWSDEPPLADNYYTEHSLAGIGKLKLRVKLEGVTFNPNEVYVYDYDPGVGAYLPNSTKLISKILTAVQIGEKVSKYVSGALSSALGALNKLLFIGSIIAFGYDALRSQLLNEVYVSASGDMLYVEFTSSSITAPKDRGIVVETIVDYDYVSQDSASGFFEAGVRTITAQSSSASYMLSYSYRIHVPP